jgi:hypothetical protein
MLQDGAHAIELAIAVTALEVIIVIWGAEPVQIMVFGYQVSDNMQICAGFARICLQM